MNTRKTIAILAALATLPIANIAVAQDGPPQHRQGGVGGPPLVRRPGAGLLMRPDIQQELRLSDQQVEQLRQLMPPPPGGPGGPGMRGPGGPADGRQGGNQPPRERGAGGPGAPGMRGGPGGPGAPISPAEMAARHRAMEAKVQDILNDGQYKRYKELVLQVEGLAALRHDDVAAKVGLSQDQRAQVEEVLRNARPPMKEGERPDPEVLRKRMETIREVNHQKLMAILTADQRATWQSMLGKRYTFQRPEQHRAPGGGR